MPILNTGGRQALGPENQDQAEQPNLPVMPSQLRWQLISRIFAQVRDGPKLILTSGLKPKSMCGVDCFNAKVNGPLVGTRAQ